LALDALLRKYFIVVVLAFIALAAYFQAVGATRLFGAALYGASSATPLNGPAPLPPVPTREPRSADPIIDRNPFDSVTGPLHPELVPTIPQPEVSTTDPLSAPACAGVTAFIITESSDPLWSVAALQGGEEQHPRMFRAGDKLADKEIAFIGFNPVERSPAVWLSSGRQLCQVLLFGTAQATASAAPAKPAPAANEEPERPKPSAKRGPRALPPEMAAKIQKVSDSEFNVDRSVVDKILENQAELMRSARIVPETKDGKVVGVRLFGIRPDTLLGTLGLQNGDRLESINGFDMASPEKALEAYARLRTANNLAVKVNRRGAPLNIDYRIK
jgi:general secretion pathway protein C